MLGRNAKGQQRSYQYVPLLENLTVLMQHDDVLSAVFSSTMRFIHINEYEYMNNYAQYIILHTRIRIQ